MFRNARAIQAHTASLVLALCLIAPINGLAAPRDGKPTGATHLPKIEVENFGRVNPNFYRGAEPDDDDYADLAALGIKTVVDLRGHDGDPDEKVLVERAGMKYFQIPMTTREALSSAKIEDFLRIVNHPANQPVFVHCVAGRHRTGVMTALYRMTHDGWTADQAFKEMKEYHFGPAFLHPEFKRFVYEYGATRSAVGTATGER